MNIEKDFGKKMQEACIKSCKAMEELRAVLSKLNVKDMTHKSKFHS